MTNRSYTRLIVIGVTLLGLLSGGSALGRNLTQLKSACGHVDLPAEAAQSGAICLGLCATGHSYQICAVPQQVVTLRVQEPSVKEIKSLSIITRGPSTTVRDLAVLLHAATGWTVEVFGDLGGLALKDQQWEALWVDASGRGLKTRNGQKVRMLIDSTERTVLFAPAQ